jgi:succinyl-diaminopimelate desuccinylase
MKIYRREVTGMSYLKEIINGISELVKIPTVYEGATVTDTMPYGEKVHRGFLWLKERALRDGFEVLEFAGHALAIRIKGMASGKRIDVVSHLDVVEPGEGWASEPFDGRITGEYIHGRGTQDMKGPLMITYYALKYMKDHNIPCKNELRLVIGGDEERTMDDIRYYAARAGGPDFAFTPDGKFPISYGEKGALMFHITGTHKSCISSLEGGVQCNVISPAAVAYINDLKMEDEFQRALNKSGYTGELIKEKELLKITVHGKAAHASRPEDGANATVMLLDLIQQAGKDPLARLLYNCFYDSYGKGAGMEYDLEPMGKLTLNLGILKILNNKITAVVDCRYPLGITSEVLTKKLKEALEPFQIELGYDDKPTLTDVNSPYIKVLLDTYRRVTKDTQAKPLISGGVTYSKAIANCVAFGPLTEEEPMLAHQADERIEIQKVEKLYEI